MRLSAAVAIAGLLFGGGTFYSATRFQVTTTESLLAQEVIDTPLAATEQLGGQEVSR